MGLNIKQGGRTFSRRQIDELTEKAKEFGAKGLAWINIAENNEVKSPIAKFLGRKVVNKIINRLDGEVGDLLIFIADKNSELVMTSLGSLRVYLAKS